MTKLTLLDLSTFDTSKVTNMDEMFRDCKATIQLMAALIGLECLGVSFNVS